MVYLDISVKALLVLFAWHHIVWPLTHWVWRQINPVGKSTDPYRHPFYKNVATVLFIAVFGSFGIYLNSL